MCIDLSVVVIAGVRAHSVALTAFGGNSAMELLSALVVLRRFRLGPKAEKSASHTNAILLYTLAANIVCTTILFFLSDERPAGGTGPAFVPTCIDSRRAKYGCYQP